jgi:hypothetical protein
MLISPRTVLVTRFTCYARQSCHKKPEVRTRLYNLDADGKDIRLILNQPVLKAQTGFIWHRMGTGDCCKHGSEPSSSIKLGEFIDWCTTCYLPKND